MKEREIRGGRKNELSCKDDIHFEINTRTISLISRMLKRFGLNFKRIGVELHMTENKIHRIILEIEKFDYKIVEKALKAYLNRQKARGKVLKQRANGLMPLEYYLTAF